MQEVQQPCQRSAERFGLALPATMDGVPCACHDISATGVLLETSRPREPGERVALDLQYDADGQPLHVHCTGLVVRAERHGQNYNVAVRLDEPLFQEEAVLQEGGTG